MRRGTLPVKPGITSSSIRDRSWLPGDPRGFRSRNPRKHSDGDEQHPPPIGQHAGLYSVVREQSRPAVRLPEDVYLPIGLAVIAKCHEQGHRILSLSVDGFHVQLLVELPDERTQVKQIVGSWKQKASHTVRDVLPGSIWSRGCDPIRINHREHHEKSITTPLIIDIKAHGFLSFREMKEDGQ